MTVRNSESIEALLQLLLGIVAWLLATPLTLLISRDTRLNVFAGRNLSAFADNSKYFYSYLTARPGIDSPVFLSTCSDTVTRVRQAGGVAEHYPSWRSVWLLLRCHSLVVDAPEWGQNGVYPLSRGARIVQLWHGAPLKQIELDVHRRRLEVMSPPLRTMLGLQKAIIGRYPEYDVLLVTSAFFAQKAFSSSFRARQVLATGYPRNDALLSPPEPGSVAANLQTVNIDQVALAAVRRAREQGGTVCLFMPTFRGTSDDTLQQLLDLQRLSDLAQRNNSLIVFKLHPYVGAGYDLAAYPGLIQCAAISDVYPLLPMCDILITDYSSIYFDFLLLDRPIIFLPYDLESYTSSDRPLYFDYDEMTPGPHCKDMDELERALQALLADSAADAYSQARADIRQLAHDNSAGDYSMRLSRQLGM